MLPQLPVLAAFFSLTGLSYLLVALWRGHALRHRLLDMPNDRSSHSNPTPCSGGVVFVVLNLLGWLVLVFLGALSAIHALVISGGACLLAVVSFRDDLRSLPCGFRLLVHTVAALLVVIGFTFWHAVELPMLGTVSLGLGGAAITMVWIAGMTNAFNFMDGIDGMAAGQASAAGVGWILLGLFAGDFLVAAIGGLLAATSLGFLMHNWQPACIFMGDVGSTFLGYSFGILPVIAAEYDRRLALCGVLLVWPTVFDSAFTTVRRLRTRQSIFIGHREFLFHRLVATGWSHAAAASLYLTLPVLGAVVAFTWEWASRPLHEAIVSLIVLPTTGLWFLVRHEEKRQERLLSGAAGL